MKILQVSSATNYGGGEKHFVDLCRGLAGRGHEIFVALRRENTWASRLDFLPAENISDIPLRNSLDILSAQKIAGILRPRKIEIIHAHLARDYPLAALAARLYPPTKFVLTRHVLFPLKSVHRLTLSNLSKAIAVSAAVEANLQKILPPEKIVCIPNGIEIERFAEPAGGDLAGEFRRTHKIPISAKLIGSVGELKKLKGQEDFVLAAAEIAKKYPAAHFILVGRENSKTRGFRQKLKRLVRVLELADKFTFLDWLEDTAPLLAALDVFVSPSHSESFGLAILEALASGTAVVATRTAGAEELIENKLTGRLVPVEQPVALAEAVSEVLADAKTRRAYGARAQEFAHANFGLEKMIDTTEQLYRSLHA